ncbi:hypothetical protein [Roseateles depolymerans]|uniref:Uncharacterized protein n=1 Tax=Roseateles depolymerans TaxID=76731 RepID=A0A0U3MQW8_9BURK|nr:hypothetical protein [Roseateles depolymerans]ALV06682.1 hypothetical protein RD2015_2210 [Roseateles depolymerans]REG19659.1 hypothetical protein DES44_2159 [Roseateles depolymerans]
MVTHAITHDVPPPAARQGAFKRWPFDRMSPGDSFVVQATEITAARKAASKYGAYNGERFTTETQPDGTLRVWRIA